jgi:hypothetical protein
MATKKSKKAVPSQKAIQPTALVKQKKVGRPRAKHSDPTYKQMSVYVHQEVRNKVKARLFERGEEFSGLVESLLREWLIKV